MGPYVCPGAVSQRPVDCHPAHTFRVLEEKKVSIIPGANVLRGGPCLCPGAVSQPSVDCHPAHTFRVLEEKKAAIIPDCRLRNGAVRLPRRSSREASCLSTGQTYGPIWRVLQPVMMALRFLFLELLLRFFELGVILAD